MIKIHIDTRELEAHFSKRIPGDAHGATVKALTWTARDAKEELIASLGRTFTVRSRWIPGSIRSTPAEFKSAHPSAFVGTVSEDLEPHVEGGLREKDHDMQSVPVMARAFRMDKTTIGKWPGRLLRRRGHFARRIKGKYGRIGIYRRALDGRAVLMWVLQPRVLIKARWHFRAIVEGVVAAQFAKHFERGWETSPVKRPR